MNKQANNGDLVSDKHMVIYVDGKKNESGENVLYYKGRHE